MSLATHYRDWTVVPRWSVSGGLAVAAGYYSYRLEGSRPCLPPSGAPPGRVPFTDRHTEPLRDVLPAPTANVRYTRQTVAYGQAAVAPHEPFPDVTSPFQRYFMTFVAAGPSAGIPSASTSTTRDPSFGGRVHYLDVGTEPGRSAAEFRGEGFVLDGSFGGGEVTSGQILFLDWPNTIVGGLAHFASRLQHAIESGQSLAQIANHYILRPTSAVAVVGGYSSGWAAGVTLYLGRFFVDP